METTINYKVPASRRPMWLLRCIAEFRDIDFYGANSSRISAALNECLNRQTYSLGGGSGEYSGRSITRHHNEEEGTITIMSVTGKVVLCVIEMSNE